MSSYENYVLIDALLNKPINYTPIWLMRQAGRYLPEYRKIREQAGSFLSLCKNPDLAAEVTIQPLKRFDLDAAILFSDILVIPDALGLDLYFVENEGPKFSKPIITPSDIDKISILDIVDKLDYVFRAIKNVKGELKANKPLIGFSGSPFTLACYMFEGKSSKDYLITKKWLYNNQEYVHKLLEKLTEAIILYLNTQIESGVDVIMIFDSWGGILPYNDYLEFSFSYLKKIIEKVHKTNLNKVIPNIVFTKGGAVWLDKLNTLGATAIGIDWTMDIGIARKIAINSAIQGNLDPVLLALGDRNTIKTEVSRILNNYKDANNGNISGHVFNLGHGILPITNIDNVSYLVDLVHNFKD